MPILELSMRIVLSFLTLLVMTRIMGRKEISQMTFFNFVSAITIGTIGGALVTDSTFSIRNGLYAIIGWSVLTVVLGLIDINSKKTRVLIEGQPLIVIKEGKIMEQALKKARLDVDALKAMLREKGVFSLSEVQYAIFETDGKMSVLKKEGKQNVTKSDMSIQLQPTIYPNATGVISDGMINYNNLSKLNLNQEWLENQLQKAGIDTISDVFYAEVQKDGKLYIDNRNDLLH